MSFSSFTKNIFRRLGFVLVRSHHASAKYVDHPPREAFDDAVLHVFPSRDGLRFIQIGANDGIRGDPVRQNVLNHGWRGVLVEPLPPLFEQLKKNYADRPGLEFVNAAIDVLSGTRKIFSLRPGLSVPDWAHGLPTFDLARLQATARTLGLGDGDIVAQEIRTMTWDDLRAAFGPKPCDVLVVDAEGYDIILLRAAGLDRWQPRVIQFEHSCASEADRLAFYGELLRAGYEISSHGPDTVAWLKPAERS